MRTAVTAAFLVLALPACTWVPMDPGAGSVRVLAAGAAPSECDKRGEVSVTVKDSIAFYERNALRVRDELETMARNEAQSLQANTIQPLGEPVEGEQRFSAYRCPPR